MRGGEGRGGEGREEGMGEGEGEGRYVPIAQETALQW